MEALSPGVIAALCGFGGGAVLGFCARWGRFCTLGAIEDASLGGDFTRLRMWGLAIAVAIASTYALDQGGLIDIAQSFYLAAPATLLATATGGVLFGIGMAFVGTCGFGTLARIGGGDLKSIVTFLVMGITAYATMSGATAYLRVALFPNPDTLETSAGFAHMIAGFLDVAPHAPAYALAILIAGLCLASADFRSDRRFVIAALLVGLTIAFGWFGTGFLAADPFEPYPLESFRFSAPMGETILYVMTMTGASLKFGIGAVFGVIAGAAATALAQGYFRWEACDDAREMRRQILGGFLMGVGGVTAVGCTVGQGLSAASTLSYTAPIALVSIFAGAWIGLHQLVHGSVLEPLKNLFSSDSLR